MHEGPLAGMDRADLCTVGRELMLAAHLQDRAAIPAVLQRHSTDEAFAVAIDEWMTSSPIYARRLQRLLGFEGTGMSTIFKGLQLDVGFPHQFLDVGYDLHDERNGEFWLRSCGALADVLPMGEEFVHGMCHDIEDPTFDATAVATEPRARVRPIHRPPGVPRGGPDCHWRVTIDPDAEPTQPHPYLEAMQRSVLADLPNDPGDGGPSDAGGWDDYTAPFDPHFELERLSQRALRIVLREFAVQSHLLARSAMCALDRRHGPDEAVRVGRELYTGIGWVAAERMARALQVDPTAPDALATVLPLTTLLLPADYVGVALETEADGTTTITLDDTALGLTEADGYTLPGLLAEGADEIIESLVHGVDPTARVEPAGARSWRVSTGVLDAPVEPPSSVSITRFSTGVAVELRRRLVVQA